MVRILVFPSSSELSVEIIDGLAECKEIEILTASSSRCINNACNFTLPYITDQFFTAHLNRLIIQNDIDFIFPAHDLVLDYLIENTTNVSCKIIAENPDLLRICRSKSMTYTYLSGVVNVPKTFSSPGQVIDYPVFVKPDKGYGSKKIYKVGSAAQLKSIVKENTDLLISYFVPGEEFTVDCMSDINGKLKHIVARKRIEIKNGITTFNRLSPDNHNLRKMAESISHKMKIRGPWFFQARYDIDNKPVLLEIGPRISGNMGLMRFNGLNAPLLSYYILGLQQDVKTYNTSAVHVARRKLSYSFEGVINVDTLYIDLDDTIIRNGIIDPYAVALLYKCWSHKIHNVLITRSKASPSSLLHKFGIAYLFTSVEHLQMANQLKSSRVVSKNSIFIDDSFSERYEVYEKTGVPVFSPSFMPDLLSLIQPGAC